MSTLYERHFDQSRLFSKPTIVLALRVIWVVAVIWCEFGVFFYSLSDCRWPDKVLQSTHPPSSEVKPTRVLLVADARLRNPFTVSVLNSCFGYDSNTAYLRRSWRVISRLHPDVVMFLGDTFATSRYVTSEAEYDQYYRAFEKTFPRDASMPLYLIPGNNDIGLGDSPSFSKDARRFFEERFGPPNRAVPVSGHQLVLLDAPGLVEEDYRRHGHGQTYENWVPLPGGPIEFVQSISDQGSGHAVEPKILLSHIPLSRPSSKSCGPLREKGSIRAGAGHGYQSMLGKQTTEFLLKTLQPAVVFSGDNRDYCEVTHEVPGYDLQVNTVREVTVKSFSPSRHIRRPGFQLLSLVPPHSSSGPTFADVPCHLPDTLRVFRSIYVPCFVSTALVLLYLNVRPSRRRKRPSNLSPISSIRYNGSSYHPEPESAIWTTLTPLKSRIQGSPVAPLPLSTRVPSTKSIPSYRASPASTPQGSPLLSPITLFPSGDEGDVEEDYVGPSHYNFRREVPYNNGWQGEHDDENTPRDRDTGPDRSHLRAAPATYFLPPPSSQHVRAQWSFSWSFVFRGRRRRVTLGVPDWKTLWSWLGLSTALTGRRRGRGLMWRLSSDCVSVMLPAVIAWAVIGWLFF